MVDNHKGSDRWLALEEVVYLTQGLKPRPTQLCIRDLVRAYCEAYTVKKSDDPSANVQTVKEYCRSKTLEYYRKNYTDLPMDDHRKQADGDRG